MKEKPRPADHFMVLCLAMLKFKTTEYLKSKGGVIYYESAVPKVSKEWHRQCCKLMDISTKPSETEVNDCPGCKVLWWYYTQKEYFKMYLDYVQDHAPGFIRNFLQAGDDFSTPDPEWFTVRQRLVGDFEFMKNTMTFYIPRYKVSIEDRGRSDCTT